jgi:enamine deaminase RidA (YjgF/YER057c/UK114 family)
MHPIDARLADHGITLPEAAAPVANYVPWVIAGGMVWISGQISRDGGGLITGKLGAELDTEGGAAAARVCAIAILAQLKSALGGDWSRLDRAVKLVGFVNSTPDFADQPKVVNGASDLMVAVLGDAGRHARSAVSAASLPLGVAVEVEAVFALRT